MAVTASKAATAGGRALASWLCDERADLLLWSGLILAVCVEEDDLMGVRGGMPTGLDMAEEEVAWLFMGWCVGVSTVAGLVLRGEGLERMRVRMLSDDEVEERCEGGEWCR